MFGYINPLKAEMKMREYEIFKAYYCAVCKSIKKKCGQLPRLALSYDAAFLAVLLSSLSDVPLQAKRMNCAVHPLKKGSVITTDDTIIEYAAEMNIILAYYNLKDSFKDDKSLSAAFGSALLKRCAGRVKKKYPQKCAIIEALLSQQEKLETAKCGSMDEAAEPFAGIMQEVLCYEGEPVNKKSGEILRWLGYNLGKWIYILDALDDIEKDLKKKTYNPLIYQFEITEDNPDDDLETLLGRVEFNLTHTLSQISSSMELLDMKKNKSIAENIINMGMLAKTEQIINKRGAAKKIGKSV
ncbi:MAG: DUF5685 family protein [Eubacteriales bacterium]|nr:DUF5685 family protein [Eubacteriales bacterium]